MAATGCFNVTRASLGEGPEEDLSFRRSHESVRDWRRPSPGSLERNPRPTLVNSRVVKKGLCSSGPPFRGLEMEGSAVFSGRPPGMGPRVSWGTFG